MQSTMRKSMKSRGNQQTRQDTGLDSTLEREDVNRQSNGDGVNQDAGSEANDKLQPLREEPYSFILSQEKYLEGQETRCVI